MPRGMGRGRGAVEKPKDFGGVMKKLVKFCSRYIPVMIFALVLGAAGTVCQIIGPDKLKDMTNEITKGLPAMVHGKPVMNSIDMDAVSRIAWLLVALYVGYALLSYLQSWLMANVTQRTAQQLREAISQKINRLPLKYFDKVSYGDVLSRITNDVDAIGQTLGQSVGSLITSVTLFFGALIMMFYNNVTMTLCAIGSALLGLIIMGVIMKVSQKYFTRQQVALGDVNGHVEEMYTGHTVVKAYCGEERSIEQFEKYNNDLYVSGWKSQFLSGLMMPIMNFVGNFGYVIVCVVGAALAMDGQIEFGVIVAFMMYIRLFTQPLSQFAQAFQNLQRCAAASERVFGFLEEPELSDETGKQALLGVGAYLGAYTDEAVYERTANDSLINIWSDNEVYLSRGFALSFLHSVPELFPEKPEGYDARAAQTLLESFPDEDIPEGEKVAVMGVMLEAFCDLTDFDALAGFDTVQEVYAPWHALEEQSLSGRLLTNIFAGGTVDTEWGFLTGASEHDEYCGATGSYVRYFTAQGYAAHYAHPGYSWFYDRERVNDYLGFDRSVFTENGFGELVDPYVAMWHSDQQLADYLLADLDAADGSPLFSFAVSYQNHGPYAETESAVPYVSPEASGWSQESCNILNNYLFGVNETVREYVRLTQELDARDTPVVLVLFGDHKPWMGNGGSAYEEMGIDFDTSTLAGFRNYYATPYLIWANRAAKEVLGADFTGDGGDFSPCFLMTRLFDACGWTGPGYMQLSRDMRDISPLLHTNGLFLHDGVLTSVLSDTDRSFYRSWLAVQYYREHVAAYS